MPFKNPKKRREYQRSIREWRVRYNRRYRKTLKGRALFISSRHKRSIKLAKIIDRRNRQKNGWPDFRFRNGFLIEEKHGLDFLSAEQISAHRWIFRHFRTWVKIDYYPRIKGAPVKIRFDNYKKFISYFKRWKK